MIVAERSPRRTVLPMTIGVALQSRGPEAMRQHRHARGIRAIVCGVDEAAAHGPQAHHVEERAADHSRANDTRLAETDHREADGREVAKRGHGLHA